MITRKAAEVTLEPAVVEVTTDPSTGEPIEVTISRAYKINAGNYESQDSFVAIKYTVSAATDMIALGEKAQQDIDAIQSPDLFRIQDIVGKGKSMIHDLIN